LALIGHWTKVTEFRFLSKKTKEQQQPMTKLVHNEFFNDIATYIAHSKTSLCIKDKGKQALAQYLFEKKCKIWGRVLYEVAHYIDHCNKTCVNTIETNHIYNMNLDALNKGLELTNLIPMNPDLIDEDKASMRIFLDKFNGIHESKVEFMREVIKDVAYSSFIQGCRAKQHMILLAYDLALGMTLSDLEKTLSEINGDLNGFIFQGHVISGHEEE
jgi:hypothetical protein